MSLLTVAVIIASVLLPFQDTIKRPSVPADPEGYPQKTPQDALNSVLKAVQGKRIDYLLTHLADPQFVAARTAAESEGFAVLLREANEKLVNDPGAVRHLQRLAKEGEWKIEEDVAVVALKEGNDRTATFRKADGRWVMQNQYRRKEIRKGRGGR